MSAHLTAFSDHWIWWLEIFFLTAFAEALVLILFSLSVRTYVSGKERRISIFKRVYSQPNSGLTQVINNFSSKGILVFFFFCPFQTFSELCSYFEVGIWLIISLQMTSYFTAFQYYFPKNLTISSAIYSSPLCTLDFLCFCQGQHSKCLLSELLILLNIAEDGGLALRIRQLWECWAR